MSKILWLDVETTGLDCTIHSIIQISGIIDIDGIKKSEFTYDVKPHKDFEIDEDSLKINKITKKMMSNFPEIDAIHSQLKKEFGQYVNPYKKEDKFLVGGYKVDFDINFLSHFFTRQSDPFLGSWINFRNRIELLDITKGLKALDFIKSENLKLETLCKEFGIDIKAHNSASDIKATRDLYYLFKNNVKFIS